MALTFPLALPVDGAAAQYFEIEQVDYQSQRAGGRVNGVTAGFPLWHASWSFGSSISRAKSDAWRAFVASLRGGKRPFFGYDQSRPYPLLTPRGFAGLVRAGTSTPYDGTATSWATNAEREIIAMYGQPNGFILSVGDYAMFRWVNGTEPRRSLHRVTDLGIATGAGALGVTIEPPIPNLVPGSAICDVARPNCIMKLKPEAKIGTMGRAHRVEGQVLAIQDLRE
ncbi:hypothetical protein [Brevundimonas subvibrioides]|uniref:Uncharacterized protein n=1 Tax=Brevundimonas subvibrioides (strain ATCC 15264 / DSM 4735 / LMG 14903 / NBRC 16000 / CB 81) TaxID=633149 RepID=D9QI81_BRESC|nr:hypothetical protein [Brevundimonas subvibrioides]ADK99383.1 hypothetical protein Bresu_0069 [Brevundimonas subvibrioides ATCC 15264]